VQVARGRARRAIHVATAVLLAAVVAGLRRVPLPFDGSTPPRAVGIAGATAPSAVATALWSQVAHHPVIAGEAFVLAAAAVALPHVRGRGPWPPALFAGALLAATATVAPAAPVLPLVAAAWLTAAALALQRPT
jgi:hypothetical protein